jgi:hypothetical protein
VFIRKEKRIKETSFVNCFGGRKLLKMASVMAYTSDFFLKVSDPKK